MVAATDEHEDERTIDVVGDDAHTDAERSVLVSIEGTNAPVVGGEWLEAVVNCTNPGSEETTDDLTLAVGDPADDVDTTTVTVPPDGSTAAVLGYETYPVRQDVSFPLEVRSVIDSDRVTVSVHGTE